jgi:hypothetical protein
MCQSPCIGTPEDIARLIAAGHRDKLAPTLYAPLLDYGVPPVSMVAPLKTEKGCVFRTEEGLCSLHASGLKPLEGKLASCKHTPKESLMVIAAVTKTWL